MGLDRFIGVYHFLRSIISKLKTSFYVQLVLQDACALLRRRYKVETNTVAIIPLNKRTKTIEELLEKMNGVFL